MRFGEKEIIGRGRLVKMDDLRPIYEPKLGRKMRIVCLFSGGASSVPFMTGDERFEVVGAISSNKNAPGIERVRGLGIPVEVLDIHDFYGGRHISDMKVREEYEERLCSIIAVKRWNPDLIACSGYMYVLTKFLDRYPHRVLNVHPADLSIESEGRRKYAGLNVVKAQIEAGEAVTRSTVHLMIEDVDHGPILCISDGLPVEGRSPEAQQELMKVRCDGPAYRKTLGLLAGGRLAIDPQKRVFVKTAEGWRKVVETKG